jgi:methionyl-tRNA synthetase
MSYTEPQNPPQDSSQNSTQNPLEKPVFYITTTLPYVNADPHIGFALEIIQADIVARYKKLRGYEVFFNTGTDEHGLKIHQKAIEQGDETQIYVDRFAHRFMALKDILNLSYTHFIRTTDKHHIKAAQVFWNICLEKGDIYKAEYETKYCIGCELEKQDSELEDGLCPIHPTTPIQLIKEENYFFKYSHYQQALLNLYQSAPDFVIPKGRFNEIKSFVEGGLKDFSISRLKEKMPWGIPVPGDDKHVMYVWFDALVNYISTTGWPENKEAFVHVWPGVQVAGKDNLRQQAAMWQAMLISAGLPTSKQIFIHGFITSGGQKMSKSLGNVINPLEIVSEYGADTLRYFIAHQLPAYEDGDFTLDRFKEAYNTQLANGIGNLTSRILKMAVSYNISFDGIEEGAGEILLALEAPLAQFNFAEASDIIWRRIGEVDRYIQEQAPFKKIKVAETLEEAKRDVWHLLSELYKIAVALEPIMPETSAKILTLLKDKQFPEVPLFMRKD